MLINEVMRFVADHIFTSNKRFTWYDKLWLYKDGYYKSEQIEERVTRERRSFFTLIIGIGWKE